MKRIKILMSDAFFESTGNRTMEVTANHVFKWSEYHFAIHRPISSETGRVRRQGWVITNLESGMLAIKDCDTIQEAKEKWERVISGPFFNPASLVNNLEKMIGIHGRINDPANLPDAPARDWKKTAEESISLLRNLVSAMVEQSDRDKYGMAYLEAKAFIEEQE